MVMRTMRKNLNILKWMFMVLAVVLVVGLVLPASLGRKDLANAAAVVDGEPISGQTYSRALNNRLEQERQAAGGALSEADSLRVRRDTLNQMIDDELAFSHAKSLGQTLSRQEFQEAVMADPSLRDQQGRFDPSRYQRILQMQADQGMAWQEVEETFQRGMLLGKVRSFWASQAVLTPAELAAAAARYDRQVKVQAGVWDLERLRAGLTVGDEDLHSYYSEHKQDWAKPEQLKLRQILIRADFAVGTGTAKAQADALLAKIKGGADFKALAAKDNAEESARKNGGDLGWLGRDDLRDPVLSAAAFALKPGQVSAVIQTAEGFHILKAEDRKAGFEPSFANSRDKALKELGTQRAAKEARGLAAQALSALKAGTPLAKAVQDAKGSLQTSGWFGRDDAKALPALGESLGFAHAVLDLDKGAWLDAPVATPKAVAIAVLSDERAGAAPSKDEAKAARLKDAYDAARSAKAQALYRGWLDGLRKSAGIRDQSGVLASK